MKILIVEDSILEIPNRRWSDETYMLKSEFDEIKEELKPQGTNLNLAQSYTEFEEKIESERPDIVITDLGLPYDPENREEFIWRNGNCLMPVEKFKEFFERYKQNYQQMKNIQKTVSEKSGYSPRETETNELQMLIEAVKSKSKISGYERSFPFGICVIEKSEEMGVTVHIWTLDGDHGFHGLTYALAKGITEDIDDFIKLCEEEIDGERGGLFSTRDNRIFIGFKNKENLKKVLNLIVKSQ